jgi:hypothetical protein
MDAYFSKEPIKFVGFLAAHISEIIAPSAKKITHPIGEVESSNSSPAIGTLEPKAFSP